MKQSRVFQVVAGLLVAGALVHVGTLVPRVAALMEDAPSAAFWIVLGYVMSAVTALLACLLAAFLLWKAPDRPAARALVLFLAFLGIFWGSLFRFVELTQDAESISVGLEYGSGWLSQTALAAFLLSVTSFLRFTALFPRELTGERLGRPRHRWLRRVREATLRPVPVWGAAIVLYLVSRFVPEVVARLVGPPPLDPAAMAMLVGANLTMMGIGYIAFPVIAAAIGVSHLTTSYRLAEPGERRRMLWVYAGVSMASWLIVAAVGVGVVAGTFDVPERVAIAIPVLFGLAPLLVVVGSAIGVLYGGAIDPGLALQRSTVYGFLAALAVVAFAALENGLSALVETRLGLPGFAGSVVAGGIVAAVLIPVRNPLRRLVRRRLGSSVERGGSTGVEESAAL